MPFNAKKFKTANYSERTEDVPVPQLKEFFADDEKPIWTIRAISGEELYSIRSAVEKARNTDEILSQLLSGTAKQKAEAALKSMGLGDDLPDEYIRRLHILKYGSAEPALRDDPEGLEVCKKLAAKHGTIFDNLTTKIMALTGLGFKLGESNASGTKKKSKAA